MKKSNLTALILLGGAYYLMSSSRASSTPGSSDSGGNTTSGNPPGNTSTGDQSFQSGVIRITLGQKVWLQHPYDYGIWWKVMAINNVGGTVTLQADSSVGGTAIGQIVGGLTTQVVPQAAVGGTVG